MKPKFTQSSQNSLNSARSLASYTPKLAKLLNDFLLQDSKDKKGVSLDNKIGKSTDSALTVVLGGDEQESIFIEGQIKIRAKLDLPAQEQNQRQLRGHRLRLEVWNFEVSFPHGLHKLDVSLRATRWSDWGLSDRQIQATQCQWVSELPEIDYPLSLYRKNFLKRQLLLQLSKRQQLNLLNYLKPPSTGNNAQKPDVQTQIQHSQNTSQLYCDHPLDKDKIYIIVGGDDNAQSEQSEESRPRLASVQITQRSEILDTCENLTASSQQLGDLHQSSLPSSLQLPRHRAYQDFQRDYEHELLRDEFRNREQQRGNQQFELKPRSNPRYSLGQHLKPLNNLRIRDDQVQPTYKNSNQQHQRIAKGQFKKRTKEYHREGPENILEAGQHAEGAYYDKNLYLRKNNRFAIDKEDRKKARIVYRYPPYKKKPRDPHRSYVVLSEDELDQQHSYNERSRSRNERRQVNAIEYLGKEAANLREKDENQNEDEQQEQEDSHSSFNIYDYQRQYSKIESKKQIF